MKAKTGNKLLPLLAAASILLLVGLFTGTENLVTADRGSSEQDQAHMHSMMQQMGNIMGGTDEMHEDCEQMMGGMMRGMMGAGNGMTQAEHESHH